MRPSGKRILIADDEETIRRLLEYNLRKVGFEVVLAKNGAEAIELADGDFTCALVDLKMPEADGITVLNHLKENFPDVPVVIMSAVGQVKDAVIALKSGALEYVTKPFDLEEVVALAQSAARMGRALQENRKLQGAVGSTTIYGEFSGKSPAARDLLQTVARVALLDSNVLIRGESGVGKGLIARMIHRASRRSTGPFVTISCSGSPRESLESEMFGHERGAFAGAIQRRTGRIELAEGGTVFLDEVGDLPLLLQPKLLTVLQERQFTRMGGSGLVEADIRLIAATDVDLPEKVEAGEFRDDLFYRLNVIPIVIPPLRERLADLPELSANILSKIAASRCQAAVKISERAFRMLERYSWPGNVRELENVLERASAFCAGSVLEENDFPPELSRPAALPKEGKPTTQVSLGGMTLEEIERLAIQETLQLCQGNKAAAARQLGITEKSIYNKMTRLRLR